MCQARTTAHPKAPHPLDPAEGRWWMDGVEFKPCEFENECVCQEYLFRLWCFYALRPSLMLKTNSDTFFQLIPNTFFVLDWCNHYGHASTLAKRWSDAHPAPLRITGAGVSELCLVFSIRELWCSGLSFLFQLFPLHSQIISITSHFLWLYTTGQ